MNQQGKNNLPSLLHHSESDEVITFVHLEVFFDLSHFLSAYYSRVFMTDFQYLLLTLGKDTLNMYE